MLVDVVGLVLVPIVVKWLLSLMSITEVTSIAISVLQAFLKALPVLVEALLRDIVVLGSLYFGHVLILLPSRTILIVRGLLKSVIPVDFNGVEVASCLAHAPLFCRMTQVYGRLHMRVAVVDEISRHIFVSVVAGHEDLMVFVR